MIDLHALKLKTPQTRRRARRCVRLRARRGARAYRHCCCGVRGVDHDGAGWKGRELFNLLEFQISAR